MKNVYQGCGVLLNRYFLTVSKRGSFLGTHSTQSSTCDLSIDHSDKPIPPIPFMNKTPINLMLIAQYSFHTKLY